MRLFFLFFLYPFFNCGQQLANYINNPSFEKYYMSFVYPLPEYWCATDSSKSFGELLIPPKTPSNNYGYQMPRHGSNYFIVLSYCPTCQANKRAYPKNRLKNKLLASHVYCVSFYVALSNRSSYGIENLGTYFGDGTIDTITVCNVPITYLSPQIKNTTSNIIKDTLNWTAALNAMS